MAYNYGYPVSYSPYQVQQNVPQMQQPMYSQQTSQMQNTSVNNMVYVHPITGGEAEANVYPVASGCTVWLVDYSEKSIYVKTMDVNGMPLPLRILEFNEIVKTEPQNSNSGANFDPNAYVSKSEFEELKRQIQNMNSNNYQRKDKNNNAKPSI